MLTRLGLLISLLVLLIGGGISPRGDVASVVRGCTNLHSIRSSVMTDDDSDDDDEVVVSTPADFLRQIGSFVDLERSITDARESREMIATANEGFLAAARGHDYGTERPPRG